MATIYQFQVEKLEIDLSINEAIHDQYSITPLSQKLLDQSCCSEEEKRDLVPLFVELLSLHHSFKDEGISAIESEAGTTNQEFLNEALRHVLAGVKPEKLDRFLMKTIKKSRFTGKKLLEQLMIRQGVLSIVTDNHPTATHQVLTELLDFDDPGYLLAVIIDALSASDVQGEDELPFKTCR